MRLIFSRMQPTTEDKMSAQYDREVAQLDSDDERRSGALTDSARARRRALPVTSSRGLAPIALADYEAAGRLYKLTIC
jgi:hypothetical protein